MQIYCFTAYIEDIWDLDMLGGVAGFFVLSQ